MHRRDSQISPSLLDYADGTKNGFVAQENEPQGCPEYFPDTWWDIKMPVTYMPCKFSSGKAFNISFCDFPK